MHADFFAWYVLPKMAKRSFFIRVVYVFRAQSYDYYLYSFVLLANFIIFVRYKT